MKKVWILEKFASREEMENSLSSINAILESAKDENQINACKQMVESYKKLIDENPEGRWYGFEGKIIYNQFVVTAREAIRRNPDGKFRVVEAEISDDATMWPGYKFVKVNEGVLRYLIATK